MANSIDTLLREVSPEIYEIRVMAEVDGDTPLDVPNYTTKRVRIYGIFRKATQELFEKLGITSAGDAIFYTRTKITMTSQIEHNDIIYEIENEIIINPLHTGESYGYTLRTLRRIG